MKTNLKDVFATLAVCLTMFSNAIPTWAGSVGTPQVLIHTNQAGIYASGSMVGSRYSADSTQYIGCFLYAQPDSQFPSVRCFARDSAGNNAFCLSVDSWQAAEVQGMTDSSHIYFTANRTSATCDNLVISNYSSQLR